MHNHGEARSLARQDSLALQGSGRDISMALIDSTSRTYAGGFAAELGRRVQAVITRCLLCPGHRPNAEQVSVIARAVLALDPPMRGRRTYLLTASMATAYARYFAPPDPWRLVASEVRFGRGRADLLYCDGRCCFFVDEIKTARIRSLEDRHLAAQVAGYQAGGDVYGSSFLGVRVALLRAPSRLLLVPSAAAVRALPGPRPR